MPRPGLDPKGMKAALALLDGKSWNDKIKTALYQEAHELRSIIVQSFRQQKGGGVKRWAPLSKATLALRRSKEKKKTGGRARGKKALVATGQMRKAIQILPKRAGGVLARGAGEIFVGIPRGVRHGAEGATINLALIHEFGAVMKPTVKQTRWFWAAISKAHNALSKQILEEAKGRRKGGSKGISLLIIPPRPFMGPSIERWGDGLDTRLAVRVMQAGGGG